MLGSDDARQINAGKDSETFTEVVFHIVPSADLTHDRANELRLTLENHGATQCELASLGGRTDWRGLTHIITSTIDFDGYDAAEERMLAVVRPKWVDDSLAKQKLANPRSYSPDPRLFFAGLQVCTADLPEGDNDAIIAGVLAMGGLYSGSLTRLVTHLVATSMDAPACQMATAKGLPCKIVLPHWFDDCLRLGRRIADEPYRLPNPEVLRLEPYDNIDPDAKQRPQANALGAARHEPPSAERQRLTVFEGKKLLLSNDLGIADHLHNAIRSIVDASSGMLVWDVADADILICQYRDGSNYQEASAQGKTIGSLAWFYHVVTQNTWTSPLRKLLHYPVGREGIPGFRRYRISLSNYSGGARTYLENLAKAAGCEFTRTMKQTNTHLITAHPKSEKCEAAREWNVHIVNHLWLEESYAKWQIQSVSEPKYSCFPPRTNLGEVVGMTPIDKTTLVQFSPSQMTKDGPANTSPGLHEDPEGEGIKEHKSNIGTPITTKTPFRSKVVQSIRTKTQTAETPARAQHAEEKENQSPPTTGRREAAEKAAARLHELAPDIALYEKEKKRIGGGNLIFGGRPTADEIVQPKPVKKTSKRKAGDADEAAPAKKSKSSSKSASIRLLVTGYNGWTKHPGLFQQEKARLRDLGIAVTPDPLNCTHLAAPKVLRTPKFICAMARAPVIVHLDFIAACLREEKLVPAADYPLDDEYAFENGQGEARSMQVSGAVELAREQRGHLFRGQQIFVTDAVDGGFDAYQNIVGANGGRAALFKARQGLAAGPAPDGDDAIEDPRFVYLVSGGTLGEAKLGEQFAKMAQGWGKVPRIVTKDWILLSALSQEVQPSSEYALRSEA